MRIHDSMWRWYGVPYSSAVKLPAKKLLWGKEKTKSQYFESVFLWAMLDNKIFVLTIPFELCFEYVFWNLWTTSQSYSVQSFKNSEWATSDNRANYNSCETKMWEQEQQEELESH